MKLDWAIKAAAFAFNKITDLYQPTKVTPTKVSNNIKVFLDPGHSYTLQDRGSRVVVGGKVVDESDIILDIVSELAFLLDDGGFTVLLTRASKTAVPLSSRLRVIHKENPDIFISIDCGSSESKFSEGIEVFHKANQEESIRLAKCINKALTLNFSTHKDLGISVGTMPILKRNNIPASVVLSVEYITNEKQLVFLVNNKFDVAKSILHGIKCYCKIE